MKRWIALGLAVLLALGLCACGSIKEEDVMGTWGGTWTYNGKVITDAFTLGEKHTYVEVITNDGNEKIRMGTYEIDGKEVKLHENGEKGSYTAYTYKNGTLVNNGHKFTKMK